LLTATAVTGVTVVVGFVSTPLLLRWLGTERFGVFRAATDWFGFIGLLEFGLAGGLETMFARSLGTDDRSAVVATIRSALRAYMAIAGLMIVVGAGLTVAMPNLTRASSDLAWELQIGCVINLFGLLFLPLSLFRPLAEAGQRGYLINLLLLGQLLATTGASLIFAAAGGGLIGQFVALVVGSLPLYFGLTWDAIGRYPELLRRGLLRPEIGRQIRSLSWPTFLFNLSSRLRNQSDNILVALFLGPLTVAQFFLTQRVIALVGTQATTVGTATWAGLVDLHYRGENQLFTLRLTQLTRFTAVISTALLLPVGIWNRSLISLWVGADQYAGPIVTSLAAINAWALSLFSLWGWMLSGSGLVRLTLPLLLVNTVINVVVSVAATGLIGVSGPLLGTLAAGLTTSWWWLPVLLRRHFGMPLRPLGSAVLGPVLVGIPFAGVLVWLSNEYPIHNLSMPIWGRWLVMGGAMAVASIGYSLLAWVLVIPAAERAELRARILGR